MTSYFLTEDDKKIIERALAKLGNQVTSPSMLGLEDLGTTPDVYVGLLPCDAIIPKRVDSKLGYYSVCLYKATGTGTSYELEPVKLADDSIVRVDCYNIYTEDLGANDEFIRMQRTKFGRWLAERPNEDVIATTTTVPPVNNNPCGGQCVWTWNAEGEYWVETTDGCSVTTTTSPTTTTTAAPTCDQCPTTTSDPTTTTTTTSPTTTTTLAPPSCSCVYPDFCGDQDGQTTITGCSDLNPPHNVDCTTTIAPTTTSTTTCDCNTTTTLAPCSAGCDWEWGPAFGGFQWNKISDGCAQRCPCEYPTARGAQNCANEHTNCVFVPPPPPPPKPPPCSGDCTFYWSDSSAIWVLVHENCADNASNCICDYPSFTGSNCESAITQCGTPTTLPPTATTGLPCSDCYTTVEPPTTTSSTTTTTCNPCVCGRCYYTASVSVDALILQTDECSTGCPCPDQLPLDGHDDGVTVIRGCSPESTTTTTYSPCYRQGCEWVYSCDCEPNAWINVVKDCDDGHGTSDCPDCHEPNWEEDFYNNGADYVPSCNQKHTKYCKGTTTTTTAAPPATTTTTTAAPTTTSTTGGPTTTAAPTTTTSSTTTCPPTTTCNPCASLADAGTGCYNSNIGDNDPDCCINYQCQHRFGTTYEWVVINQGSNCTDPPTALEILTQSGNMARYNSCLNGTLACDCGDCGAGDSNTCIYSDCGCTTTTAAPTTTSTTTTSSSPCSGLCGYTWDTSIGMFGGWNQTYNTCTCTCTQPAYDGTVDGESADGTCD